MSGFWRVGFLAAAAAVAAILSSDCASSLVSGTIERRMKEKLPELLGPADSYELEVSGGTVPMTRGRPVYETFLAAQQGAGIIWDDTAHQTYSDTVNTT